MTYQRVMRWSSLRVFVSLYRVSTPLWFWYTGRILRGRTLQVQCRGYDLFVVARVAA